MSTFSNAMKVCVTCARWDGERKVGMIVFIFTTQESR